MGHDGRLCTTVPAIDFDVSHALNPARARGTSAFPVGCSNASSMQGNTHGKVLSRLQELSTVHVGAAQPSELVTHHIRAS